MTPQESKTQEASAPTLPATLRLGPVHLTVSDLDRSVGFYEDALGLRSHRRGAAEAAMGAGEEGSKERCANSWKAKATLGEESPPPPSEGGLRTPASSPTFRKLRQAEVRRMAYKRSSQS